MKYAKRTASPRSRGNGGRKGRAVLAGIPEPSTVHALGSGGAHETGVTATCPICEEVVKVRIDGTLRNHRVGTSRAQSWPCPGGGSVAREE